MKRTIVTLSIVFTSVLMGICIAQSRKSAEKAQTVVVLPFESAVKGASTLSDATRSAVIQMLKEEKLFEAVLTPEEAKDKDKANIVELGARLVDFEPGNAAKRLLVGLGTGRAHAGFEFSMKDSTGQVWKKTVKSTASFWFNGYTSSATERAELPDGVAKKLIDELKKRNH